jgi:hypothetical protein
MRKGGVKRKRKRNLFLAGLGEGFWPTPGASARAGALSAQRRPKSEGETARVREGRRRRRGPHVPEREGEENGVRLTRGGGRMTRPSAGRTRPPVGSAAVRRQWPGFRPTGGVLVRAGAGDSNGRLNLARGGWEGAVRGEVAELRGGDRRRWLLGEGLGRKSGVLSSRQCEETSELP